MAGYYRRFCHNFSIFAELLTNLFSKKCQHAFNKLKDILGSTSVLLAPDFNKSFKLAFDASDVGVGAVL